MGDFGGSNGTNQLPWVGWRGSMQKTQNSRRMIWKYARIAENESHEDIFGYILQGQLFAVNQSQYKLMEQYLGSWQVWADGDHGQLAAIPA